MKNEELIKALRYCGGEEKYCKLCPSYDTCHAEVDGLKQILLAAADALEELQQIADHHEQKAKDYWKEACEYKQRIAELEARLPKEGEWISDYDGFEYDVRCSVCGEEALIKEGGSHDHAYSHYCPNCGARMPKGEQE